MSKYHDIDGNPCTLGHLCRSTPEWAETIIKQLDAEIEWMRYLYRDLKANSDE